MLVGNGVQQNPTIAPEGGSPSAVFYKRCDMKQLTFDNKVHKLSNYTTDELDRVLEAYGTNGYKLVNVTMAKNKYGIVIMYLFFTKEIDMSS